MVNFHQANMKETIEITRVKILAGVPWAYLGKARPIVRGSYEGWVNL